jgi:hypothetical protein
VVLMSAMAAAGLLSSVASAMLLWLLQLLLLMALALALHWKIATGEPDLLQV